MSPVVIVGVVALNLSMSTCCDECGRPTYVHKNENCLWRGLIGIRQAS